MAEYIEREAVIAKCKEMVACEGNHLVAPASWADAYEEFADDIEEIPAADVVEVVHGYNKQPPGMFECSVCGWMDWDTVLADGCFNYCPNCGARMGGAEDG